MLLADESLNQAEICHDVELPQMRWLPIVIGFLCPWNAGAFYAVPQVVHMLFQIIGTFDVIECGSVDITMAKEETVIIPSEGIVS